MDELEDKEFIELASSLIGEKISGNVQLSHIQVFLELLPMHCSSHLQYIFQALSSLWLKNKATQTLRDHWRNTTPSSVRLKELGPLLRDYQRLITRHHL